MTDLPPDIFPETGCRLRLPDRDALDDAGRDAFDKIANAQAGALMGLRGPTGIGLHSPGLNRYAAPLNRYLRFEAGFGAALREIVILCAARETDSRFEWAAHEPQALKDGVPQSTIDIIKYRKPAEGLPEEHALVISYCRQALRDRRVTPEMFARLKDRYGARGVVDLASLLGNYVSTAILLATVDAQPPDGYDADLPVP